MSEVAPSGYAVLHLDTEWSQGEPEDNSHYFCLELQQVKCGS